MTKTKRAKYWVLRNGSKESWFQQWTRIGPMCTPIRGDAMRFKTKREAARHEATAFALTFFEPEAVR